jgi:hypothetical protein
MSKKTNNKILGDHKKVGQKLIPPFLQMLNMKEVSFSENTLPSLIWISAIFLRQNDTNSVRKILDFLKECTALAGKPNSLVLMNNFYNLSAEQKIIIVENLDKNLLDFLRNNLMHQHLLLNKYPLAFLFDNYTYTLNKEKAIPMLREDVSALLNRYSHHATKVQTTAFVSMCTSGKITLCSNIKLPDLNSIFINPNSDESKKVGSMMRASMNANAGLNDDIGVGNWANSFWQQVFLLEECN